MKRTLLVGLVVVMVLLPLLLSSCASGKASIKIGLEAPLTGDYAYEGLGFQKAVELLVQQANANGGLLGRPVELVVVDDKGSPDEAPLVAQRLVDQGVIAVIGPYNSGAAGPASVVYERNGILQITPSATATQLTEKGFQRFFRVCFLDDRQALFAAKLMAQSLGVTRIAIVHDNSTYAKGLADWTSKYAEEQGLQVVSFNAIDPQQQDFTATLQQLKAANPQAIYFTGYHAQAGLLLKQGQEVGVQAQWVMGNASNNPELAQIAGLDVAQGTLVTTEPLPTDLAYPETQRFIDQFESTYGEVPNSIWWVMAADAFNVIKYAIEQTKSTDPGMLAGFLHTSFKDYPGLTGPIAGFDAKGDRLGTIHKAYIFAADGTLKPYGKQPAP